MFKIKLLCFDIYTNSEPYEDILVNDIPFETRDEAFNYAIGLAQDESTCLNDQAEKLQNSEYYGIAGDDDYRNKESIKVCQYVSTEDGSEIVKGVTTYFIEEALSKEFNDGFNEGLIALQSELEKELIECLETEEDAKLACLLLKGTVDKLHRN